MKVLGDRKSLYAIQRELRRTLQAEPEKRGELIRLPDMTPVVVKCLSKFNTDKITSEFLVRPRLISPDFALVEVLEGPKKGQAFWVGALALRVPDSKPFLPDFGGLKASEDDEKDDDSTLAPPPEPAAKILIIDTAWNHLSDFVKTDFRIKNISGRRLESVYATVNYEDGAGRLVGTGMAIVGAMEPGEIKTSSSMDPWNARAVRYSLTFEGRDGDGGRKGLPSTTAGAAPRKPSTKRGRR
jgi:hypothetical protein